MDDILREDLRGRAELLTRQALEAPTDGPERATKALPAIGLLILEQLELQTTARGQFDAKVHGLLDKADAAIDRLANANPPGAPYSVIDAADGPPPTPAARSAWMTAVPTPVWAHTPARDREALKQVLQSKDVADRITSGTPEDWDEILDFVRFYFRPHELELAPPPTPYPPSDEGFA